MLLTHWLAEGWAHVSANFDFVRSAVKTGCGLAADGSNKQVAMVGGGLFAGMQGGLRKACVAS